MAIHLGVRHIERIVADLLPHYGADCPVAVVFRASWPDEERVTGTLADIAEQVRAAGMERTALILVGHVLDADGFADSTLYGKD
jgi:precorrin-4/cobalt-precorrin-4 C11-methyltransferase